MRRYIVETTDGEWMIIRSTPLREALHRAPKVEAGMVEIQGKFYAIDPKRFRRIPYRPRRFLGLSTEYIYIQLWRENNPEPVDFFHSSTPSITGERIAEFARAGRIRQVLAKKTDIMAILLLFSIIGNFLLAFLIYNLTQQPTPVTP